MSSVNTSRLHIVGEDGRLEPSGAKSHAAFESCFTTVGQSFPRPLSCEFYFASCQCEDLVDRVW